jgi:hypothetical protein
MIIEKLLQNCALRCKLEQLRIAPSQRIADIKATSSQFCSKAAGMIVAIHLCIVIA